MEERKKVRILLNNGYKYRGEIIFEDEFNILLIDKFNQKVKLKKDFISIMEGITHEQH